MNNEIKKLENEVEAPIVETIKDNGGFFTFVWNAIKPGLLAFWEKDKDNIMKQLKTLAESAVSAVINGIKENKDKK